MYYTAEQQSGVPMDEPPETAIAADTVCMILRTYSLCLNDTASLCHSDLQFHSMHTGATEKLRRNKCDVKGRTWDPSAYAPPPTPPVRPDPCTYGSAAGVREVFRGYAQTRHLQDQYSESDSGQLASRQSSSSSGISYRHCGLFGDPHLRTFNNEFQTCRVQGAWPMVDNDYVTVQVTNDPVGEWEHMATATATSKVRVTFLSLSFILLALRVADTFGSAIR
jgi:hypothetical protein